MTPNTGPALVLLAATIAGVILLLKTMQATGAGAVITTGDTGASGQGESLDVGGIVQQIEAATGEGGALDVGGIVQQIEAATTPEPEGNPQELSGAGLDALQRREGFSATPYPDHKGFSVGFGHLIKPGEDLQYVSMGQALDLLRSDVAWAVDAVRGAILVPIAQSSFDALVSIAYNIGAGAFKRSTLVRRINANDPNAADEFRRWIYASGRVLPALVARRRDELQQFESGTA